MNTQEKIIHTLSEKLKIDSKNIHPTNHLLQDLKADQVNMIECILRLEEIFNIYISDIEFKTFKTVQDIINSIQKKRIQ